MRRSVEGVLLVHEHGLPHVLLLQLGKYSSLSLIKFSLTDNIVIIQTRYNIFQTAGWRTKSG